MQLSHILESCLYVDDLAKAAHFYGQVLGLNVESRHEGRDVFFRCGSRMLLLFNPMASREPSDHFPPHGAFGPGHLAFGIIEADLPTWIDRLERQGVAIEKILDWPRGGRSVYFRDPTGNLLELTTPKIWGIDESTIT